mmetsp:Transcript_70414/g.187639  ORF Transcript_70414/g.187639 Transcript_70414/m.187639 type:complete len:261 (-) Transcript_70414:647-1429(-)
METEKKLVGEASISTNSSTFPAFPSLAATPAQNEHGIGVVLLRSSRPEFNGTRVVLHNSFALVIAHTKRKLGIRISLLCRLGKPTSSLLQVFLAASPFFIAQRKVILRINISSFSFGPVIVRLFSIFNWILCTSLLICWWGSSCGWGCSFPTPRWRFAPASTSTARWGSSWSCTTRAATTSPRLASPSSSRGRPPLGCRGWLCRRSGSSGSSCSLRRAAHTSSNFVSHKLFGCFRINALENCINATGSKSFVQSGNHLSR